MPLSCQRPQPLLKKLLLAPKFIFPPAKVTSQVSSLKSPTCLLFNSSSVLTWLTASSQTVTGHLGSDAEAQRKLPLETTSQPHTLFHRQVELRTGALQAQQGSLPQTLTGQKGRKRKSVHSQGGPDPPAHPTARTVEDPLTDSLELPSAEQVVPLNSLEMIYANAQWFLGLEWDWKPVGFLLASNVAWRMTSLDLLQSQPCLFPWHPTAWLLS